MTITKRASVKVNLCLHVGPVRSDGLHDLASLAIFPDYGDDLKVTEADDVSLEVTGLFAEQLAELSPEENLVVKAARALQKTARISSGVRIILTKNVPAASGIGGGTSDAATTLILLRELWQLDISNEELLDLAFSLGADGPVCLMPHLSETGTAIMSGAGETVIAGPRLPDMWICLINPLKGVPTGSVFKAFDQQNPTPDTPVLSRFTDMTEFRKETRNDLQPFAEQFCPEIADVMALLSAEPGLIMARMSGSGATCFGLYETEDAAMAAQAKAEAYAWWAKAVRV